MFRVSFASLLMASVFVAPVAMAETNKEEFAAFSKILSLSKDVPVGEAVVSVVYDPTSTSSVADLRAVEAIVGEGYQGKTHKIVIRPTVVGDVSNGKADVYFVTEGLKSETHRAVFEKSKMDKAVTVTTDVTSVSEGNVILGIDVSGGAVKVIMHGGAYRDVGLKFDAAFEFMVKEL